MEGSVDSTVLKTYIMFVAYPSEEQKATLTSKCETPHLGYLHWANNLHKRLLLLEYLAQKSLELFLLVATPEEMLLTLYVHQI